jgi:hypothetical protein
MNHRGEVFPKTVELPRCVDDSTSCRIRITKEEALRIAAFTVGEPPSWYWRVRLRANEAFYWVVVVEPEDMIDWAEKRRFVEIDARSGEIIRTMSQQEYIDRPPN